MSSHRKQPNRDWSYPPRLVLDTAPCPECGKLAYASRGNAKSQVKRLEHDHCRRSAPDSRLREYACPHGNGWHVGHRASQGCRTGTARRVAPQSAALPA